MGRLEDYCEAHGAIGARSRSEEEFENGECDDPGFDPFAHIPV